MFAFLKKRKNVIHDGQSQNNKLTVIICGFNDFSRELYNLLNVSSNIDVLAFIDRKPDVSEFQGKPVYSFEIFKSKNLPSIPIVIASPHVMLGKLPVIDFESIYQFKLIMQQVIHEHGIENHLLHPSALIDFVSVTYPNKVIPFGLPGSGITLLSNIIAKIVEEYHHQFKTQDKTSLFFEKLCYEYTQCIHQIIPDVTHSANGFNFHLSSWKVSTTYAICSFENIRTEIYSFATRNHVIGPVYNYHKIPSPAYLNKLREQKYKLFFSMRNPLDVILSCLNKLGAVDENSRTINMELFCHHSRWVINQLKLWEPTLPDLTHFSYDDIIKNPVLEINNIIESLGLSSSTGIAEKIWNQLSFKQLSTAPRNHFWRGGSGKWETYFQKEHLSFLQEHGIEDILEKYHYFDELKKFKQLAEDIPKNEWQLHCTDQTRAKASQPVQTNFGNETHDTLKLLQNLNGSHNCAAGNSFYVSGSDADQVAKIKSLLDNTYINKIILSGTHPDYRIV